MFQANENSNNVLVWSQNVIVNNSCYFKSTSRITFKSIELRSLVILTLFGTEGFSLLAFDWNDPKPRCITTLRFLTKPAVYDVLELVGLKRSGLRICVFQLCSTPLVSNNREVSEYLKSQKQLTLLYWMYAKRYCGTEQDQPQSIRPPNRNN